MLFFIYAFGSQFQALMYIKRCTLVDFCLGEIDVHQLTFCNQLFFKWSWHFVFGTQYVLTPFVVIFITNRVYFVDSYLLVVASFLLYSAHISLKPRELTIIDSA